MELELGLKITHTKDNISSTADIRISKDPFGPVFLSRETDKMFILIAHLKGFRRKNIFIEINKDGNRMAISGEKPAVQEMVMIGWIVSRKEVEIKGFRKVFLIPDVVDLERIKAKYNEEESTLRIIMKKKVKGICGVRLQEEEEEEEEEEEPKMIKEEVPKEKVVETMEAEEEAPNVELVDKKEPRKVPLPELIEKNEPEKLPKVQFIEMKEPKEVPKPKVDIVEEIDQLQAKAHEAIETKPEEPEAEEQVEEKIEKREPETVAVENPIYEMPVMQKEPEEEPEEEPGLETAEKPVEEPETETVEEPDQVVFLETPKKPPKDKVAAAPAAPPTFPEPETMEPEVVEPQMTEMPSIVEQEEKKPPDEKEKEPMEEETKDDITDQTTQELELPCLPPSQALAEDEKISNEDDQAEDLTSEQSEEQETGVDDQEPKMEPEPDQEPKEDETPIQQQQQLEDESDIQESDLEENETDNMAGEIEEEIDEKEHHPEIDADKGPIEGAAMEEKPPRKTKLGKPLMFAGSAFLVSLIVLVINLLRARKR